METRWVSSGAWVSRYVGCFVVDAGGVGVVDGAVADAGGVRMVVVSGNVG